MEFLKLLNYAWEVLLGGGADGAVPCGRQVQQKRPWNPE